MPNKTLVDIAALAGVSRSTVSRVLNNQAHVSTDVRTRVMAVIARHNYRAHAAARSLATNRSEAIGLFIPHALSEVFDDAYHALFIQGVADACNHAGKTLTMVLESDGINRRELYARALHSGRLDGVITAAPPLGDPLLDVLAHCGVPQVFVGRRQSDLSISTVDVDNVRAARELTAHALIQGYTRIALLAPPQTLFIGIDRVQGYREALRRARKPFDPALVIETAMTSAAGAAATRDLLSRRPVPDCIIACGDRMALGAAEVLSIHKQRIGLAGFDNLEKPALAAHGITRICQPAAGIGRAAGELLIALLQKETRVDANRGVHRKLRATLQIDRSTPAV